jgi:hypothetical protein
MNTPTPSERDRFNSKCEKVGDCLLWTGAKDKDGYGTFGLRRGKFKAHRVALMDS